MHQDPLPAVMKHLPLKEEPKSYGWWGEDGGVLLWFTELICYHKL